MMIFQNKYKTKKIYIFMQENVKWKEILAHPYLNDQYIFY